MATKKSTAPAEALPDRARLIKRIGEQRELLWNVLGIVGCARQTAEHYGSAVADISNALTAAYERLEGVIEDGLCPDELLLVAPEAQEVANA